MEKIYGKHAVLEAVAKRPDCVLAIYADERYYSEPVLQGLSVKALNKDMIMKLPKDAVHQGIVAEINPEKLLRDFKTWKHELGEISPATAVVALAELNDPQNIGAIIRSAVAFGASAILIQEHRGAGITAATVKVSVGTIFTIPIVVVSNLNSALKDLQGKGFWVYGLDIQGDVELNKENFTKPTVIVVGNEAEGMREKTREHCDTILTIPMKGPAESLNAASAATVALYAWSTQNS